MLKYYKFNIINESENETDEHIVDDAIKVAIDKNLGKPDRTDILKIKNDSVVFVLLIYIKDMRHDIIYDSDIYIYSCKSGEILNDIPLYSAYALDDCLYVQMYQDLTKRRSIFAYNFMDENGFAFDPWPFELSHISKGYYILGDDDGYNIIKTNGERIFKKSKDSISRFGDGDKSFYRCEDEDECVILDENLKPVIKGYEEINEKEYYYNYNSSPYDYPKEVEVIFYEVNRGKDAYNYDIIELYDTDMHKFAEDIRELEYTKHFYYFRKFDKTTHTQIQVVIGPDCKLLFDTDESNENKIFSIPYHPIYDDNDIILYIVENIDGKYNVFDGAYFNLLFDEWYDDIKIGSMKYLDIDCAIFLLNNDKCNIYTIIPSDYSRDEKFLFNEPVDDIKVHDDFVMVRKGNDNYIVWKNDKLVMVEYDSIWVTGYEDTYVIMVDDKFDFISIYDDETFCDKFMNGEKFDMCLDSKSYYPLVKYKGKYSYINAEQFEPFLDDDQMVWFDDAKPCTEDYEFHVVINGESKRLNVDGDDMDNPEDD